MEYTKGEWTARDKTHNFTGTLVRWIDCGKKTLARTTASDQEVTVVENNGNARLMAGAAKMYEALKSVRDYMVQYREAMNDTSHWPILEKMDQALAKAEGTELATAEERRQQVWMDPELVP